MNGKQIEKEIKWTLEYIQQYEQGAGQADLKGLLLYVKEDLKMVLQYLGGL